MTNNELLSCLTRFCLVIKPTSFPQPVLNAWTISRLIKYQPKSNEKYMPFLHWIGFQVLKVILVKTWKIQPPDLLFLVVFIRRSFYISRYHFSKIFRTSFNIIWKIDFQHEFSIFEKLTNPLPPPIPLLKCAKRDKRFLLLLPYYLPTTSFKTSAAASEH